MGTHGVDAHHDILVTQMSHLQFINFLTYHTMARNLQAWQRKLIVHMTLSKKRLTISQMAKVAKCSERSVTNIRRNIRVFGDSRSPLVPTGQPSIITSIMLDALCDHLAKNPGLYVEEIALFL